VFLGNKISSSIFARVLHVTNILFSTFNDTTWQKCKLWRFLLHIFPCKALRSLDSSSSTHTSWLLYENVLQHIAIIINIHI